MFRNKQQKTRNKYMRPKEVNSSQMDKDSLQPRTWKTWAEVSALLQTLHNSGQSLHMQSCSAAETICQGWSFPAHSLLKEGTFWPSSATTTRGTLLFNFLLQHRGFSEHCKVCKEKSLLKTAQSFVADLIVPWFRGLWHGSHQAVLAQGNWWQHTAKARELNPPVHRHSGTTTVHPPGLASISSFGDFHPLKPSSPATVTSHLSPQLLTWQQEPRCQPRRVRLL